MIYEMWEEIKSAKDIALVHVEPIEEAAHEFGTSKNPEQGEQDNSPTDDMRTVFESMSTMCKKLGNSLSDDAGNISVMAKDFEIWDQSSSREYAIGCSR